jgi:hypothetical protein
MSNDSKKFTRSDFVRSIVVLPALAGALIPELTQAQAKGPQSQFKYQTKPNGSKKCSGCTFYIPGSPAATANGSCKIVAGTISPNGYCIAYSPKSS